MERLKSLKAGKDKYPYKMDLLVLEQIQEEWQDISEFERDLKGLRYAKNKDGSQKYTPEGKPMMESVPYSIHALNTALTLMVNEGLEIEAEQRHTEFKPIDPKNLLRNITQPLDELYQIAVEEFNRCFDAKK